MARDMPSYFYFDASAPCKPTPGGTGRRTFVFVPEIDASFGQVVDRQFEADAIARKDADMVSTHATRGVRPDYRAVFECDAKSAIGQYFVHHTVEFEQFFFCQIHFSVSEPSRTRRHAESRIPDGKRVRQVLRAIWRAQRVL